MRQGCFTGLLGIFVAAIFFSCGSNDKDDRNLSSFSKSRSRIFTSNDQIHAPIDIESMELHTRFSLSSKTARTTASIRWKAEADGFGYFLMDADPTLARLNGEPVSISSSRDPDGENILRVIQKEVRAGQSYLLELEYGIPSRRVTYVKDGIRFFTSMSDIASGNFLEAFAPANFETDAFTLVWNLSIEGNASDHKIFANGEVRNTGGSSWRVEFPAYFVASSFYLHLTNSPLVVRTSSFQGINGVIPITVYSQEAANVDRAIAALPRIFAELEATYGPYAHRDFIAYISGSGGMEYCGATITSLSALAHELTHSWFARGVMPSDARSGWIDEAIASWRDNGYFRATAIGKRPPTNLGNFSAFNRFAPRNSYVDGRNFLAELDLLFAQRGGLRPLLRDFYGRWKLKNVRTGDFQRHLEELTGENLAGLFQHYVYGGDGTFVDSSAFRHHDSGMHHHPPALTEEEILSLR